MTKSTAKDAYEIPTTPNLDWILHQLANEHGLEREKPEIYWRIYADAGRCRFTALDMIDELANEPIVLSCFAQSVAADQPTVVTRFQTVGMNSETACILAVVSSVAGFLIGMMTSGWLS